MFLGEILLSVGEVVGNFLCWMEVLLERLEWRRSQIVGGFGDREKWGEEECDEGVGWYVGATHCAAAVRGISVVVVGVRGEGVGWYAGVAHCIVGVRGVSVCCCSGRYQKFADVCLYQTCYCFLGWSVSLAAPVCLYSCAAFAFDFCLLLLTLCKTHDCEFCDHQAINIPCVRPRTSS